MLDHAASDLLELRLENAQSQETLDNRGPAAEMIRIMTGWVWPGSGEDPTPENVQYAWPATAAALPIGTAVTGRVIGRQPFGVFVLIEGVPDAVGLAEVLRTPAGTVPPPVGRMISGRVVGHADHHCQVRITLDSWDDAAA
ncbi:hypothetical protein OKJ48_38790 [Streptomyces kunmingensis]|uniref:RNA-binding protein n=1 Tax=Streptomyces kunmingensis TaxID=68225 RepID=A0ABU6CN17_9ACTN|nr:hypothetical protein [Streptomyces kunmingensis]MEB3966130.1 hypothetical protein [Streptomyces kunmingensis]